MSATNLTMKVLDHQKTGSGFGELMRDIVETVLENREVYGFKDKDEACDVLAQYYPRISSLVRRFSGKDRSFEPYLFSSLKYFRKSIECKRREQDMREREVHTREIMIPLAREFDAAPDIADSPALPDGEGFVRSLSLKPGNEACRASARKRILYLGLKCAFSLNDRQVAAIARLAEIPEAHLIERISFLRTMAESRFARREYLGRLRDKLFASLCYYERKLHDELDEFKKGRYEMMVERFKHRLANCRERLEAVRLEPTNTEIALVLGVPKGTVDSGIYCFKHFNAPKVE